VGKMRLNGSGKERKEMAALLTTGFNHRQHGLDKTAAAGTLHTKRQLVPHHRVTQRPLALVVGSTPRCRAKVQSQWQCSCNSRHVPCI
jgi:hypothetical protein